MMSPAKATRVAISSRSDFFHTIKINRASPLKIPSFFENLVFLSYNDFALASRSSKNGKAPSKKEEIPTKSILRI